MDPDTVKHFPTKWWGVLQAQICVELGGAVTDATAGCELTQRYQPQPRLLRLMSLENIFLVFEGPQLFLSSKFSDHCVISTFIMGKEKGGKTSLVKTLAWKTQVFFPSSLTLSPILGYKGTVCMPLLVFFRDTLASVTPYFLFLLYVLALG